MEKITEPVKKIKDGFVGQTMVFVPQDLKKRASDNSLIRSLQLTAIGYFPNAAFHDRERKSGCPHYIMLYCVEGTGKVVVQNKTVILVPNSFIILPKNVPHHYTSSINDPWSIYWVHFTGKYADFLFERYVKADLFEVPYSQSRIDLFEVVYNLVINAFEESELELCQIKLLDYLSSFVYLKEINPSLKEINVVSKSIEFMKANLRQRFTLEHFAQQQRLSVSHYSRLFRAKTGSSPTHYFNQLKIHRSCQYLYFTDLSIKEICADLGFADPFYFSRIFKKMMGISPAKYKSQYKKPVSKG